MAISPIRLCTWISIVISVILNWGWFPSPVEASPLCRTVADHQVCILKITRSAKYYWEYRAVVKVDSNRRPLGRYNCRTYDYIDRQGQRRADDVAAQVICSLFKAPQPLRVPNH